MTVPTERAAMLRERIITKEAPIAVIGIPKTIDNDIPYIGQSFGFQTSFTVAARSINAAMVEARAAIGGVGLVKLMGRHSGFIACYAALANHDADFVLNIEPYRHGTVLVAGRNFGCGSSREHAVWALQDHGFRAVIAPSFADIFHGNALSCGLVPVTLAEHEVRALLDLALEEPGVECIVDLEDCTVSAGDLRFEFRLDPSKRRTLLDGLDDTGALIARDERRLEDRPAEASLHRPPVGAGAHPGCQRADKDVGGAEFGQADVLYADLSWTCADHGCSRRRVHRPRRSRARAGVSTRRPASACRPGW
jgi:3-isopropylmalate dehydratase small subunit